MHTLEGVVVLAFSKRCAVDVSGEEADSREDSGIKSGLIKTSAFSVSVR